MSNIYDCASLYVFWIVCICSAAQLPGSPAPGKCGSGRVEKFVMERMW
jgi:hypothetical protein